MMRSRTSMSRVRLALLAAAFLAGAAPRAAEPLRLLDLDGATVDPFDAAAPATVFIFTRTDCPISNRYAPEVRRLNEKFSAQGVRFFLVYPDPDEGVEAIRKHLVDYDYPIPALRDVKHDLVRRTEADVTPEAVVMAGGDEVYRGRIDDRFVDFGKTRAAARHHDLEDALESVLAGRPVEVARTRAVGCYIPELK